MAEEERKDIDQSKDELASLIDDYKKEEQEEKVVKKRPGKIGYIGAIIANIVLIFVVNNILKWGVPFFTREFTKVLWIINLSLSLTIACNVIYLIYNRAWFLSLTQMFLNVLSFLATYITYKVFPFDFSKVSGFPILGLLVRIALIFIMIITIIVAIAELMKFILRLDSEA